MLQQKRFASRGRRSGQRRGGVGWHAPPLPPWSWSGSACQPVSESLHRSGDRLDLRFDALRLKVGVSNAAQLVWDVLHAQALIPEVTSDVILFRYQTINYYDILL